MPYILLPEYSGRLHKALPQRVSGVMWPVSLARTSRDHKSTPAKTPISFLGFEHHLGRISKISPNST